MIDFAVIPLQIFNNILCFKSNFHSSSIFNHFIKICVNVCHSEIMMPIIIVIFCFIYYSQCCPESCPHNLGTLNPPKASMKSWSH